MAPSESPPTPVKGNVVDLREDAGMEDGIYSV